MHNKISTSNISISQDLLFRGSKVIPGAVNSPVRAFTQVGGVPRFISHAEGPYIFDEDGNKYIDFIGSWGPMILGHASPVQLNALISSASLGTSFGAPTRGEVEMAELMCSLVNGLDMIRMVSSGTEATMSAIRLARAFTERTKIIKFNGCYHGHSDSLLVQAGSGAATQGISGSLGVSADTVVNTLSIEFNDLEILTKTLENIGPKSVAAIIIEPVPGNMGLVIPKLEFLQGLRSLCDKYGIILIFDEVMSGFRVSLKGASDLFSIVPDLFCFGKVIGGGLPMAAFGGRKEIMSILAPLGGVYQAGTLSGNPVAVAVGLATIKYLIENNPYEELGRLTLRLINGLEKSAQEACIPLQVCQLGSMFGFSFSEKIIENYSDAKSANIERFKKFFHIMLDKGVYFAPSAFEAGFIGITHTEEIIDEVIEKSREAFLEL